MVLSGNEVQYENGYKLGQIDPEDAKKVYIHNHLSIHLKYNKVEDDETGQSLYRIVGFTVIPHSIDQSAYQIDDGSCSITNFDKHQEITKETDAIVFSYSGGKILKCIYGVCKIYFSKMGEIRYQMGIKMGYISRNGRCPNSLVFHCQLDCCCFLPCWYPCYDYWYVFSRFIT